MNRTRVREDLLRVLADSDKFATHLHLPMQSGEIVRAYWPIGLCAFIVSLAATPVFRRLAVRLKIVDRPDDFLKPHKLPVPYLGGVAIFVGWAAGLLLAVALFGTASEVASSPRGPSLDLLVLVGVLVAGLAVTLLGLFDDMRLASPRLKLVGGAAIAVLLVIFGVGHETFPSLLRSLGIRPADLSTFLVLAYSIPLTVFVVVGACNATNLIDGVDGLCSGVLGIMAAGFLALAVHMHMWSEWHPLDVTRVVLSLAMMGAALGFLPYNRNPARIFMGDAGSMLLGLNAAILLLLFMSSGGMRWMLGALMVFGLPLGDMVLTLARRWRNQRPLMEGDRSHFYDQLLDRGWPVRRVVRTSYALATLFAVLGCAAIIVRLRYLIPMYALTIAILIAVVARMGMFRVEPPRAVNE